MKQGLGILKLADGGTYKGQFNENRIEGRGIFKWSDGRMYEGEWYQNMMHGQGKLKWPEEVASYTGSFKEDKRDGYGEYFYNHCSRSFRGYWKNDK